MDTVELEAIDRKRRERGAPSVWDHDPSSITPDTEVFFHDASKNLFFRQPGHIAEAGKLGLGVADLKHIDHRLLEHDDNDGTNPDSISARLAHPAWRQCSYRRAGATAISSSGKSRLAISRRRSSAIGPRAWRRDSVRVSVNGTLHAIDALTGTAKWKFDAVGQIHSTPSLYADFVFFGCDDGKLYAVDRHSGKSRGRQLVR